MPTISQREDDDRTETVRSAMKSAADRVTRDQGKARELQRVGKMILDYVGSTKGLDQLSNLKTLVGVRLKDDTNLSNLNASIRDSGWAVIGDYLEANQPQKGNQTSDEYEQDRKVCGLLRTALAIGAEPNALRRVRDAIKELDSGD